MPPATHGYGARPVWVDVQLVRKLRRMPPGVLIATRPGLNLVAAALAPPDIRAIGQEHMHFNAHRPALAEELRRTYGRLAALVVLTNDDLRDYAGPLEGSDSRL